MSVLTKEQLEAVASHACSIAPPLPMSLHKLCDSHEELRAELDAAKEHIAKLVAVVKECAEFGCPFCGAEGGDDGHAADCALKAALEGE